MFTNNGKEVSYANDVFFKFALASKDDASKMILHFIIKEVTGIEPYESTVLNGEIIPEKMVGKKVYLDVHVRDKFDNEYNIEMQMSGTRNAVSKRFEYYGAKLLSNQIEEGMNYEILKPVYQIIFLDSYAPHNHKLIDSYQMYNKEGQLESQHNLIHRTYIHLPVVNDITKAKSVEAMSSFEKVCYLFKNNEDSVIMKTEEKVVRLLMEKYEAMKNNKPILSLAQAIEMEEWQRRMILEENRREALEEGEEKGIQKGKAEGRLEGIEKGKLEGVITGLQQLILAKYEIDASKWLSTLSLQQLEQLFTKVLTLNTFEEVQQSVK